MKAAESRAYADYATERVRAHRLHSSHSAENGKWNSSKFLVIVGEEFGEICKAFNEFMMNENLTVQEFRASLRKEIVQTGAMCAAWIDAIDRADGVL